MQALFVSTRCGAIVQIDLLETISGSDLSATARALLLEMYSDGGSAADCCRIYLFLNGKLCLAGEERP